MAHDKSLEVQEGHSKECAEMKWVQIAYSFACHVEKFILYYVGKIVHIYNSHQKQ